MSLFVVVSDFERTLDAFVDFFVSVVQQSVDDVLCVALPEREQLVRLFLAVLQWHELRRQAERWADHVPEVNVTMAVFGAQYAMHVLVVLE